MLRSSAERSRKLFDRPWGWIFFKGKDRLIDLLSPIYRGKRQKRNDAFSSSSSAPMFMFIAAHQQVKSLKRNPLPTNVFQLLAVSSLEHALTFQTARRRCWPRRERERANLINQTAQIDSGSTFVLYGTSSPWEAVSTDGDDDDAFGLFSRMTSFWERLTTTDIDTQIEEERRFTAKERPRWVHSYSLGRASESLLSSKNANHVNMSCNFVLLRFSVYTQVCFEKARGYRTILG